MAAEPTASSVDAPTALPDGEERRGTGEHAAEPALPPAAHHRHVEADPRGKRLAVLTLTALGIVYGDIGTSPLYTIRETFAEEYGLTPNVGNVYGVLSLIVWALI